MQLLLCMQDSLLVPEVFIFVINFLPTHILKRFTLTYDIIELFIQKLGPILLVDCLFDSPDSLALGLAAKGERSEQIFVSVWHVDHFFLLLSKGMKTVVRAIESLVPSLLA